MRDVPEHLRHFMPEAFKPTPAEQFDAYLAEHPLAGNSAPAQAVPTQAAWMRALLPTVITLGMILAALSWRVLT